MNHRSQYVPHGIRLTISIAPVTHFSRAAFAASAPPSGGNRPLASLVLLEPVVETTGATKGLPTFSRVPDDDPRQDELRRLTDNEAARFIRRLVAATWKKSPPTEDQGGPVLTIVLKKGGNHASTGYRLRFEEKIETFARAPYVLLEMNANG